MRVVYNCQQGNHDGNFQRGEKSSPLLRQNGYATGGQGPPVGLAAGVWRAQEYDYIPVIQGPGCTVFIYRSPHFHKLPYPAGHVLRFNFRLVRAFLVFFLRQG